MSLLELRDIRIRYGHGGKAFTAVDGVSLDVPKGGTLGLVGESGCGKSSIARAVLGLVPLSGGSIFLDGVDYTAESSRNGPAYRRRVQMVFQDPGASLNPRMTVRDTLVEALRFGGHARAKRRELTQRTESLIEMVGLAETALDRFPHQFSGGQQQRIAIARALAVDPAIIVTDEITSALDVSIQATILNLLTELQRELGLSLLFISHDLSVVKYMSDRIVVMYLGRVVESSASEALFHQPAHPYSKALIESIPTLESEAVAAPLVGDIPDPRYPPSGCFFHPRCPRGPRFFANRESCVGVDPMPRMTPDDRIVACHFPLTREPEGWLEQNQMEPSVPSEEGVG